MKLLSVNAGSSTLKFRLYEMPEEKILMKGNYERIGLDGSKYSLTIGDKKEAAEVVMHDHKDSVTLLLQHLLEHKAISSLDEIEAVGHRVVHGGSKYSKSVELNEQVVSEIEELSPLAPLHNPGAVKGMRAFMEEVPNARNVVCFDTAFHQTMDEATYLYPVPYEWYEKYGVRKYGFHGLSHKFITEKMTDMLGETPNLIICHIGSGCSITAVKEGKCIDTSMGFTPNAGIMMGTRSGDIDPSIIPYVMEQEGKNASEIIDDLNKRSGLFGMSEYSSDMRDILARCDEQDEKAIVARDKYVRRVVDYIAQYYVLLGGADIIVFTAGVGENSIPVRRQICEELACLGVKIDLDLNNKRGEAVKISTDDSSIQVYVIPTDEELMIARDTLHLIDR